MMILRLFFLQVIIISFSSCQSRSANEANEKVAKVRGTYQENISAMVDIYNYDHYTRSIGQSFGFFVDESTIVTNLSAIKGAFKVRFTPSGTLQYVDVDGYTAYCINSDLVLLKARRSQSSFIKPAKALEEVDTLYSLDRTGQDLFVRKVASLGSTFEDSLSVYQLSAKMQGGKPAFFKDHGLAGIIQQRNVLNNAYNSIVLNGRYIDSLLKTQTHAKPIIELSGKSNVIYPSHETIRGYRIITNMGNIEIRLFNETPAYRNNFIKLVVDNFYDSLTIHRVIRGFLIQTGAGDTRDAGVNDVVGWQGPGYTLPMQVVPGIFHKRGAIGASKLPGARNPRDESDGSQFYIIAGRRFTNEELNDLEKQKGVKFSAEQRRVYTSVGGAPHLDVDYTVFGEVTKGMQLVDKISIEETYQTDRPVKDIRILKIEMLKK